MRKIGLIICLMVLSGAYLNAQTCDKVISKNRRAQVKHAQLNATTLKVVQLSIRRKVWFWNEKYNATAAFIHPRILITAGHNLTDRFDPVSRISVTVGYTSNTSYVADQDIYTEMYKNIYVLPSFNANPTFAEDYGIIILPDSSLYKHAKGYFNLTPYSPAKPPKEIFMTGFPDPVRGIKMWTDKTRNFFYMDGTVRYDFFTDNGSSGSPIYTGSNQLVAIHTGGYDEPNVCNLGTIITPAIKSQIRQWAAAHGIRYN